MPWCQGWVELFARCNKMRLPTLYFVCYKLISSAAGPRDKVNGMRWV